MGRLGEWAENAVDRAVAYLRSRGTDSPPFYLNIGTIEAHASRWEGCFSADSTENRADIYGGIPPGPGETPAFLPDLPQVREMLGRFQGAVRHLDTQFGRFMYEVDRFGYKDNTLVIFTTDHGMAGMRAKKWLYDKGVETALLMRMPEGAGGGGAIVYLLQNIDLAPTILDAAGLTIPGTIQGKSFWPLLCGSDYEPHREIYTERNWHNDYDPMRAVRTERYHYIRSFGREAKKAWLPWEAPSMNEVYHRSLYDIWPEPVLPRPAEELYDTFSDPEELNNLAGDPDYAGVKAELAEKVLSWMRATGDPLLEGDIPDRWHGWAR